MDTNNGAPVQNGAKPSPKEGRIIELNRLIEEEKKKRIDIIISIKKKRKLLKYKEAELEALSKQSESAGRGPNIGRLRRMKDKLEFRISTETRSLGAEKEIIREINDIDSQIDGAIKIFRMKRRINFLKDDTVSLNKEIDELDKKIEENHKRLDDLYSELRSIDRSRRVHDERKPQRHEEQGPMSISLEDIAVIKKKSRPSAASIDEIQKEDARGGGAQLGV